MMTVSFTNHYMGMTNMHRWKGPIVEQVFKLNINYTQFSLVVKLREPRKYASRYPKKSLPNEDSVMTKPIIG